MSELFYNFYIGGENEGYYYLNQTGESLFSQTKFLLDGGEVFINTFSLKLDQVKVTAYKYRDGDWVDFSVQPANYYPTSAYPLLLTKAKVKPYTYTAIRESDGAILGETTLKANGDDIIEMRDGQINRHFTMKGDLPVTIDWGGPISHLCQDAEEAVKGSEIVFDI